MTKHMEGTVFKFLKEVIYYTEKSTWLCIMEPEKNQMKQMMRLAANLPSDIISSSSSLCSSSVIFPQL